MGSRSELFTSVALSIVAAAIATTCKLDLDPSLMDERDASPGAPDGAGGATLTDGAWSDAAGGKAGSLPTGGTSASDAPSEVSGGSGGCTPDPEDCANGADDDCDSATDCADADCAFQACASDSKCKSGACASEYITATVECSNSGQTGTSLCQAAGWPGCADSTGYWWWQCAGPGDCPTAWSGLACTSYSSGKDCVGVALSGSQLQTANKGCASAYGATDFGYDCSSYNPGYTVRARCQ